MSILINEGTTVLIQGMTGREATMVTGHSVQYGTRVVAGVTPGKGGCRVHDIPVYGTVREALNDVGHVSVSLVYVPPANALAAVLEACEADIPLMVVMTERVPLHDVTSMLAMARSCGSKIVGPNSVGLITPGARVKVGAIGGDAPDRCFRPGRIGIISRSGGMTGECAWLMSRVGLGVSTAISVGGDPIIGLSPADALRMFEEDEGTDAVFLWGEPGTPYEEEAAALVASGGFTKPLVAFLAGYFIDSLPSGTVFGHTAAIVEDGKGLVATKRAALQDAGVVVVDTLNGIATAVAALVPAELT